MPKSTSGRASGSRGKPKQPEKASGAMQPLVDAIRSHPVAAAAAVAAGGLAVASLARGGRKAAAPAAESGKKPAKKAARKAAKPAGTARAPRAAGGGLARKVQPDALLAAIIGGDALTRADITKRMWEYIKKNGLQDASNRRMINADGRLRPIFGADQVSMFEMTRLVNQHVGDPG